ncbi:MAG: hypothetical protein QW273_03640 [Candidatus Pacearchaeota archaeon]
MAQKKFQEPWVYISSFIFGTLLFILIFILFFQINYYRSSELIREGVDNTNKIFEVAFSNKISGEDLCSKEFSQEFNKAFYFHISKISDLENALGKDDWRVLTQKKIYTLAQMQHYLITKEQIERCGLNKTILLFFYNNSKEKIRESEILGEMISSLVRDKEEIQVYSIDGDLELELIKRLMKKFEINYTPSVFIEGKKPYSPKNIKELKDYLNKNE